MASVDKFTAMHGFQVWLVISLRTPKCLQQFPGYVLDRKGGHSESERLQTETRCADMWGKWALWSKIYIAHYSLNSRGYIYIYTIWPFFHVTLGILQHFDFILNEFQCHLNEFLHDHCVGLLWVTVPPVRWCIIGVALVLQCRPALWQSQAGNKRGMTLDFPAFSYFWQLLIWFLYFCNLQYVYFFLHS